MKLPKDYFENLSASKYREYLKILPAIKKENAKAITMLIFTLIGLSILGLFAISPTLSTIIELRKQLEDSNFVHDRLITKMNNLSGLQQQYELLKNDLPLVFNAIPKTAAVSPFVGQVEAIAQQTNVKLNSIQVGETELSTNRQNQINSTSFNFSVEAEGSYEDLLKFISSLSSFNRIVTVESIALNRDPRREVIVLTTRGKGYFKK